MNRSAGNQRHQVAAQCRADKRGSGANAGRFVMPTPKPAKPLSMRARQDISVRSRKVKVSLPSVSLIDGVSAK